ncbi:MAG: 6-bladed beta-propeller, partial [Gemmatimonadetes bacterium]|nr:6-bladed beta-propeller [Gemmatimonadota bacterium]
MPAHFPPAPARISTSHLSLGCHVAIVVLCAGCGASDRSDVTGPSRADSTGVEIVRNADKPLLRGELVQPARRVFGSETEGPELFGGLGNVRLHPNGSLWITERQTQEIKVFDPGSGAHLFTIGGRGDGPGEFQRSGILGFDAEGSAYVYDDRHRRLSVFSESGELLRADLMPSSFGFGPRPLHVTRTGTLLGQIPRTMERIPADGSTARDTVRIWTMPLDGTAPALLAQTSGPLWYFRDGMQVVVPYTGGLPSPYAGGSLQGFRDDRVYLTDDAGEASYYVYGRAGLERRVVIDRAPLRIDGLSVTEFVEDMRRIRFPEHLVRIYEEHLSDMPIGETRRPWDRLVVTDRGGAWLLRADATEAATADGSADVQVWDGFDAEGVFLGPVRVPANILLIQVSEQSALTIVYDEMDRATVAIYEVRWMASSVAETRVRGSQRPSGDAPPGECRRGPVR